MNKKELIAGPSCLTRAEETEPVFLLRANDENAPAVIRHWARLYLDSKQEFTPTQRKKYVEACAIADLMEIWRRHRE